MSQNALGVGPQDCQERNPRLVCTDACVTPVLSFDEVADHPHMSARDSLVDIDGVLQPAPAPRFSRTRPSTPTAPGTAGADTAAVIADWQA